MKRRQDRALMRAELTKPRKLSIRLAAWRDRRHDQPDPRSEELISMERTIVSAANGVIEGAEQAIIQAGSRAKTALRDLRYERVQNILPELDAVRKEVDGRSVRGMNGVLHIAVISLLGILDSMLNAGALGILGMSILVSGFVSVIYAAVMVIAAHYTGKCTEQWRYTKRSTKWIMAALNLIVIAGIVGMNWARLDYHEMRGEAIDPTIFMFMFVSMTALLYGVACLLSKYAHDEHPDYAKLVKKERKNRSDLLTNEEVLDGWRDSITRVYEQIAESAIEKVVFYRTVNARKRDDVPERFIRDPDYQSLPLRAPDLEFLDTQIGESIDEEAKDRADGVPRKPMVGDSRNPADVRAAWRV